MAKALRSESPPTSTRLYLSGVGNEHIEDFLWSREREFENVGTMLAFYYHDFGNVPDRIEKYVQRSKRWKPK